MHLLSFTCGDLDGTQVEEEAQTHATSLEPEWCRRKDGEGNGNPLQYSCLGNPWTEEPGDYSPGGCKRVRHDFSDWTTTTTRRKGKYAAAKSRQSCPTLCDPIDGSPPGSPVPGILQARTLEWVATSFCNAWKWKVKVNLLSPVRLLVTSWTAAYQAPPSMGFSRQEYWSRVTLLSPKGKYKGHQIGSFCRTLNALKRK